MSIREQLQNNKTIWVVVAGVVIVGAGFVMYRELRGPKVKVSGNTAFKCTNEGCDHEESLPWEDYLSQRAPKEIAQLKQSDPDRYAEYEVLARPRPQMRPEQVADSFKRILGSYDLEAPMKCPKCGAYSVYQALECEKCGAIYLKGEAGEGFLDTCPKCGFSKEQERRS